MSLVFSTSDMLTSHRKLVETFMMCICLPWFAHQKVIDKYGKCNKSGSERGNNFCITNGPPPSCPQNNGNNTSLEFTHLKVGNAIGAPSEVSMMLPTLYYNLDSVFTCTFLCVEKNKILISRVHLCFFFLFLVELSMVYPMKVKLFLKCGRTKGSMRLS